MDSVGQVQGSGRNRYIGQGPGQCRCMLRRVQGRNWDRYMLGWVQSRSGKEWNRYRLGQVQDRDWNMCRFGTAAGQGLEQVQVGTGMGHDAGSKREQHAGTAQHELPSPPPAPRAKGDASVASASVHPGRWQRCVDSWRSMRVAVPLEVLATLSPQLQAVADTPHGRGSHTAVTHARVTCSVESALRPHCGQSWECAKRAQALSALPVPALEDMTGAHGLRH